MQIETISINAISPDPANARKHGPRNLDAIIASLRRFGQVHPIIIDSRGIVRAGNGRLTAAKSLGWTEIAVIRSDLPLSELTAFAIADNRTAELAEWDSEILAGVLGSPDLGDVGFDSDEIRKLVEAIDLPTNVDEKNPEELGPAQWMVVVTCVDEADQVAFLEEMTKAGRQCKAVFT